MNGGYEMIQGAISYDRSLFNGLLSVEAADAEMRTHDKLNTAFSVLAPVFQKYDMCEVWGLALLHKHWPLGEHELPITTLNRIEIPREYELRPRGYFSEP